MINMAAIIASQTAMRTSTQLMLNSKKKKREAEESKNKEDKNRK